MREEKKWSKVVEEFKNSGKSQRKYSEEKGIKRSSLRYWIERLEELEIGEEVVFAEITVGEIC